MEHVSPDEKELRSQIDKAHDHFLYMLKVYCTAHPDRILRFTVEEQDKNRRGRTLFDSIIDVNGVHEGGKG